MLNPLQKYIDLAQKTGDRLIILDPVQGHDVVIMKVEEYEQLIHRQSSVNVADLSLPEFSQKINEDLALWRAHHEEEQSVERPAILEEELKTNPLPDPFAEDFTHTRDWHGIGEVIGERYKPTRLAESEVPVDFSLPLPVEPESEVEEEEDLFYEIPVEEEAENLAVDGQKWQGSKPLGESSPVFFEEPV